MFKKNKPTLTMTEEHKRILRERNMRKTSKKRSKVRIVIWLIEIVFLLSLMEHIFYKKDISLIPKKIEQKFDYEQFWTKEVLKKDPDTFLFKGTKNVDSAKFAKINKLEKGSKEAFEKQKKWVIEKKLPLEIVNSIGIRFRLIPSGKFIMGSPKDEKERGTAEIQHEVTIKYPFYMGMFEVTQEQWNKVMKKNPSSYSGKNIPVEEVTWYAAKRFIKALCEKENVPLGRYRLPTEEEWEYTCRAGTTTPFYFPEKTQRINDFMVFGNNSGKRTSIVGRKIPNAWGIFNMHGNVWEWCSNIFTDYLSAFQINGNKRVIRGGNWRVSKSSCRSANRCRLTATSFGNLLGFRILRSIVTEIPVKLLEKNE